MMENTVLKKVTCNTNNIPFQICAIFLNAKCIDLTILQGAKAWNSTVTQESLLEFSRLHKLDFNEYFTKLKDYIMNTPKGVVFSFNQDEFVIYRSVESDVKVKYFTQTLQNVEYPKRVEQLLNLFFESNLELIQTLKNLQQEHQTNLISKNECELQLRQSIEQKQSDEETLYSNFIQVLNEKKRRIQHLSELLEAFKHERPTSYPSVKVERQRKNKNEVAVPKTEKKEIISDSYSSSGDDTESLENYNTDEDDSSDIKEDNKIDDLLSSLSSNNCKPSSLTSKPAYDFLNDEPSSSALSNNLTKRVRSETDMSTTNYKSQKIESKIEETSKAADDNSTEAGPAIDFNTQDLLDLI